MTFHAIFPALKELSHLVSIRLVLQIKRGHVMNFYWKALNYSFVAIPLQINLFLTLQFASTLNEMS